jgi:hypothetical protein
VSPLGWLMIAVGLVGGSFLAYGITCAIVDRRGRAERATLKRSAAKWAGDEAPAGTTRSMRGWR